MRRIRDGKNAEIGMGMWVRRISMGIQEDMVAIQKMGGNQGGNAGNQGGNLNIAVEITLNTNENNELKDWRKVKIINLVLRI